ncbi:MAG: hypothetical protein U0270_30600 [Labilithrix sp.]
MRRWTRRSRIAAGLVAAVVACNLVNLLVPSRRVAKGTCPSVLLIDGDGGARLGASVLAGALYPWAARTDVAPLPELRPTNDEYRLRLANDGEDTTDLIEHVAILIVDHDDASEVLATPAGRLVAVRDAVAPRRQAHDVDRARLTETWTVELERPAALAASRRALLVLGGRSTPFAERAFFEYLATMGRGVSPLMEHAVRTDCGTACAREVMEDELDRLGLPLRVTVDRGSASTVAPISPALGRRFPLPIELPADGDTITLRLEAAPGFWEIDAISLAAESDEIPARTLEARPETRAEVPAAGHVDLRFTAPPATERRRSAFVAVRGHYRVPIGGALLHPITILEHRWGMTSLPRFAASQ